VSPDVTNALCTAAAWAVLGFLACAVRRTEQQLAQARADAKLQPLAEQLVRETEAAVQIAGLEHQLQQPDARKDQP